MTEQRFICGLGFPINSDDPIRIITDREKDKDYFKFSDICEIMNEQQATIKRLQEDKPFIKIIHDYMIEYDGCCFSMHKPSDIRSFVYLMNRNNGFDELQCGYNDESMVIDDE